MITTIRDGAKEIVRHVLNSAIKSGDIKQPVPVQFNELAEKLDFPSSNHFCACIQYLEEKKLITSLENQGVRFLTITVDAIDFLES